MNLSELEQTILKDHEAITNIRKRYPAGIPDKWTFDHLQELIEREKNRIETLKAVRSELEQDGDLPKFVEELSRLIALGEL